MKSLSGSAWVLATCCEHPTDRLKDLVPRPPHERPRAVGFLPETLVLLFHDAEQLFSHLCAFGKGAFIRFLGSWNQNPPVAWMA